MRPDLVSWRPSGAASNAAAPDRVQLSNYLALGGAVLALALLIGFYWVVASLVQRAENGREQARLASERQMVCSAFGNIASRELCTSTVGTQIPEKAMLRTSYEPSSGNGRKRQLTASLH